ncbi:MAG: carboxypeptidase regulatory-like domain-containing protein, partial [Pedobacter sp.]
IYGYIYDADRKALAGIRVVLSDTKYFALTDKNGRYEIIFRNGVDVKKATLVVESVRYAATKQLNYNIAKQSDLVLNKMEPMIVGKIMVTKKGNKFL